MGAAPFGYLNKTAEDGRKYITIDETAAETVRWIFEKIAEGVFNGRADLQDSSQKGFNKVKTTFWDIIRNPIYCGKIM